MSKAELKQRLIKRIRTSENEKLLEKMYKLMDEEPNTVEEPVYKLSAEESRKLEKSREAIAQGRYLTDEEAQKRLDKWFEE